MSELTHKMVTWFYEGYNSSWAWINQLDRQGWIMLLTVCMIIGFLCMRGFGSRTDY